MGRTEHDHDFITSCCNICFRSHIIMENRERINVRKRVYLAMLGIFALFVWAGFLVGPVLAVLASVMPAQEKKHLTELKI